MKKAFTLLFLLISFRSQSQSLYFPPVTGTAWDTASPASLGWCQDKVDSLISYLGARNTKAFLLLKDGKMVIEHYYGSFTADSAWTWNSAGKSLTSFLVGLAQETGQLSIADSMPKYLHNGFSSCTVAAEDSIRLYHELTMTTGFDDKYGGTTTQNPCTDDSCLVCIAAPGTRWAYHNAPYTMLHWIIDSATGQSVNQYTYSKLTNSCGITGLWLIHPPASPYDEIFASKAQSMARFGLLMLAKGTWNGNAIMHDTLYFHHMTNTSQLINRSYGYLWWLNGKASYHIPGSQVQINSMLEPHAPADMIAALGKNEQFLNIVPSMGLVVVRMGNTMSTGPGLEVGNTLNDSLWIRINDIFCSNSTTGIPAINAHSTGMRIYPVPAVSSFTVAIGGKRFQYTVTDICGRIVAGSAANTESAVVTTDGLSNGFYFVRAITGEHEVYTGKVWVQH